MGRKVTSLCWKVKGRLSASVSCIEVPWLLPELYENSVMPPGAGQVP